MEKIINWIMSLSKGGQIGLASVFILLIVGGGGLYLFKDKIFAEEEVVSKNVIMDFPDATESNNKFDKLEEMRRAENQNINDYWDNIGSSENGDGGLLGSGVKDKSDNMHNGVYLDPSIYTPDEIERIRLGLDTKESIDARKAAKAKRDKPVTRKKLTPEQEDSAYFARLEKTYAMAMKYSSPADQTMGSNESDIEETVIEPKKIDIESRTLPSVSLTNDGIISSLDGPSSSKSHMEDGSIKTSPVKATFLKTETLISGQRVTMRLMEDLVLSNGIVVPANTHVKGICKVSDRLNIEVSTISTGGKIYYTDIDIYDNDGTEGIYCPIVASKKSGKAAKNVAKTALSGVASGATTLFTRSATLGRMVDRSMNEITGAIDGNGNVTVKVSSGYEFYMFEEVED